jgi:hypothetical protein
MKKVLITLLFVCTAAICSALPNFGAKIGANFSKFSVSKSEMQYSFQPGFDIGFFARVKHQKIYVQPELFYSYQVTKATVNNASEKFKSHNLVIPVLLGYKLLDVKMTNVRVFLGPEFSYVLSEDSSVDLRAPANVAGIIGAGIDIAMLTVDLRYGYTFNRATKDDDFKFNPHNNVIGVSLGWKFL